MQNNMKKFVKVLLSMKENGEDLNHQLKTVQGMNIKTNRFGAEWDSELESFFYSFLCPGYRMVLDLDNLYLYCDNESYLSFKYMLHGHDESICIDLNTLKHTVGVVKGQFILPFYEKNGEYFQINQRLYIAPSVYFIGEYLAGEKPEHDNTPVYTLQEAIVKLGKVEGMDKEKWSLASFIEYKLQEQRMSKTELAEETGIKYKTLISKLKMNTVTGEEFIRMAIAMEIDLNEAKYAYQDRQKGRRETVDKDLAYIASLVKIGFTSGLVPSWELVLTQKQLYPLSPTEQSLVAKEIESGKREGFLSGDYPRKWTLVQEKGEEKKDTDSFIQDEIEKSEQLEKF